MRVAAIYDIHANLAALEAVLGEIRALNVDRIVVGGDVLPGPFPRETIAALLDLNIPTQFIHGNGDREVLAVMDGVESEWFRGAPEAWRAPVRWCAQQLQESHRRLLSSWPSTCEIKIPSLGNVLFCHATPRNDTDIFTRVAPENLLLRLFDRPGYSCVVCGHTHMQFDRMVGSTRVVNAGSVGMPFGAPGADWLVLGPDIELRHTEYDFSRAAELVRATTYPQAQGFAERNILAPLSEDAALAAFEKSELKLD